MMYSPMMSVSPTALEPELAAAVDAATDKLPSDEPLAFAQCKRNAVDASDPAVVAHHEISRFERNGTRVRRAFLDL